MKLLCLTLKDMSLKAEEKPPDERLQVVTERFTRDELYIADEAFLPGTAAEITPIREVDGRTIGDGVPGPVTRRLQERFFDVVRGKDEKFINWLDFVP